MFNQIYAMLSSSGILQTLRALLRQVVQRYITYPAISGHLSRLEAFRTKAIRSRLGVLKHRSEKHRMRWARFGPLSSIVGLPDPRCACSPTFNFSPIAQVRNRTQECRTYGSVRGARGNPSPSRNLRKCSG
jgi:hypothetical protein